MTMHRRTLPRSAATFERARDQPRTQTCQQEYGITCAASTLVAQGQVIIMVGPSGQKSLEIDPGLKPLPRAILINDRDVGAAEPRRPRHCHGVDPMRSIALTVAENIGFGLHGQAPKGRIDAAVAHAPKSCVSPISSMKADGYRRQRQRGDQWAITRADVFLFDEPSNLGTPRAQMR